MFNKSVMLYCKEEDNFKVEQLVKKYLNRGVRMVSFSGNTARNTFDCSIFKLNDLKRDVELYNSIGIKTEMIGA